MVETPPKLPLLKRRKKALAILGTVLAVVIVVGVIISTLPSPNTAENTSQETAGKPNVEITNTVLRTDPSNEHIVYVDLSLNNSGGAGTMVVWTTISDGTTQFTQNESVYFNEEELLNLTVTFPQVNFANMSDVHAYPWIALPQTNSNETSVTP